MPCMMQKARLACSVLHHDRRKLVDPSMLPMTQLSLQLSCRGTATALQSRLHKPRGMRCQEAPRYGPACFGPGSSVEAVSCLATCTPIPVSGTPPPPPPPPLSGTHNQVCIEHEASKAMFGTIKEAFPCKSWSEALFPCCHACSSAWQQASFSNIESHGLGTGTDMTQRTCIALQ